jgi:hypothetical protein
MKHQFLHLALDRKKPGNLLVLVRVKNRLLKTQKIAMHLWSESVFSSSIQIQKKQIARFQFVTNIDI